MPDDAESSWGGDLDAISCCSLDHGYQEIHLQVRETRQTCNPRARLPCVLARDRVGVPEGRRGLVQSFCCSDLTVREAVAYPVRTAYSKVSANTSTNISTFQSICKNNALLHGVLTQQASEANHIQLGPLLAVPSGICVKAFPKDATRVQQIPGCRQLCDMWRNNTFRH